MDRIIYCSGEQNPSDPRKNIRSFAGHLSHIPLSLLVVGLFWCIASPLRSSASTGRFLEPPILYQFRGAGVPVVGDFNRDGKADLIIGYPLSNVTTIMRGNGDGTLQAAVNVQVSGAAIAAADLNNDGKLDLVIQNGNAMAVSLGNGDGSFQAPVAFSSTKLFSVRVADFNGDGRPDLVGISGKTVSILLGNGDGSFEAAKERNFDNALTSVGVGDFNHDGKPDLALVNFNLEGFGVGFVAVLLGNGDGTFKSSAANYQEGVAPESVALADFNGDGNLDVAITNSGEGSGMTSVLLGNGDGTLQPAKGWPSGAGPGDLAVADFNGDGHPDLIVSDGALCCGPELNTVSLLINNGDGTFQPPVSFAVFSFGAGTLAVADFKHDGAPDVAVLGTENQLTLLLNTGGTYVKMTSSADPSIFGQAVNFTIRVFPGFPAMGTPTGTVTLRDGRTFLGTARLSGGTTTLRVPLLSSGVHSISSFYSGTAIFNPKKGPVIKETIAKAGTTTTLTSSFNPSGRGEAVTFAATVRSTTSVLSTGAVTFKDGTLPLGTIPLNSKAAAFFTTSSLSIGQHLLTAVFSGNSNLLSSTSPTLTQVVSAISLSPTTLIFASQSVGTTSAAQSVTVANKGKISVTFSKIVTSGDFEVFLKTCGPSLAAGANCAVRVVFHPLGTGERFGHLFLFDSAAGSPQTVSLKGTGVL
jgi:Bacterial Ig-like domain (group 3)/FG-GAP-like repeat/FG-GAP repeat